MIVPLVFEAKKRCQSQNLQQFNKHCNHCELRDNNQVDYCLRNIVSNAKKVIKYL